MPIPPARRAALRRRLLAWYDAGHRALPWRFPQRSADPYRVWVAEVLLQQTQVRAAAPYYERFLARFPRLEDLAAARVEEVLALWSGLGYYARARNLHAAAREALARHGGLPASVEALRALPGFGPYTAGAVASIAFAIPVPAVDGNVARVLARLFLVAGDPGAARVRARIAGLAGALVARPRRDGQGSSAAPAAGDPGRPGDLNQALMDLGATVCGRPAPACGRCPVVSLCAARAAGRERELPAPRRRPARRSLVLACAIVRRGSALLVERRPAPGLFGGLWAPPSAELGPGETAGEALSGAMRRGQGPPLAVHEELAACERTLTHRRLTLRAFRCDLRAPIRATSRLRFVEPAALDRLGVPAAIRDLLSRI